MEAVCYTTCWCVFLPLKTLKRKEKEFEHEMERLAREKISTQQRLAELKNELSQNMDAMEIDRVLRQTIQPEDDQASTSTASGAKWLTDVFSVVHQCNLTWVGIRLFWQSLRSLLKIINKQYDGDQYKHLKQG